jgi:hypothetical protein
MQTPLFANTQHFDVVIGAPQFYVVPAKRKMGTNQASEIQVF